MSRKAVTTTASVSRRTILKGAGALAGVAAGSGAVTGFPAVWSAEEKVLRYLGTAANQSTDIAKKVKEETGITLEYIPATTDDVSKRVITQPNSFDVLETEYFSLGKLVPSGNILGLDAKKIKEFDNITPVFTKGKLPNGKLIGDQGTAPKKVMFVEGERSTKFAKEVTEWVTLIPTTYNADTLGIRPDLINRPITTWAELLNPEFKGKAAILDIPSIGIMDAAMVVESLGKYKYPDKGNMTKAEIDLTVAVLTEAKKAGQFRAFWKDFNESVNLMASGETVIQSMWSPAVTAVRTKGIACTFQPLKEGYRAWATGFCMSKGVTGKKAEWAYEFVNWFLSGWAGAYLNRQGYYSAVLSTAKANMVSPTNGPTGWKESRPNKTFTRRTALCLRKPASRVMAALTTSAWAASLAGTRSWTKMTTWSANGMSSSPHERMRRGISDRGQMDRRSLPNTPRPPTVALLVLRSGGWSGRLRTVRGCR